jgi:hypothetical protein
MIIPPELLRIQLRLMRKQPSKASPANETDPTGGENENQIHFVFYQRNQHLDLDLDFSSDSICGWNNHP